MEPVELLITTLSRIVHVGTAIVLLGGSVFMRYVLMPAADKLTPEAHDTLRAGIGRAWKIIVHVGIVLFLLTGFYNFIMVSLPAHKGDSLYHALLGIKILLALVIFFLASALVGRAPALEKMRQQRKLWLSVIIVLGLVIVAISGYVKVRSAPLPPISTSSGGKNLMHDIPQFIHAKWLA